MEPVRALAADDVHLGDVAFWLRPQAEREGAFATLREERPVSFHEEPELPLIPKGPGFWDFVFESTNVILGAGDPEYGGGSWEELPGRLLTAGAGLAQLVQELARERRARPTDDLTSALVNAELDGERPTDQELGSFLVLLAVAGNETTRNAISHGMRALCEFTPGGAG